MSSQESLRRLGDCVLAQIFHPEPAAEVAALVLIPATEVPRHRRARPTADWITVAERVEWCGQELHDSLIDAVYAAQLLRGLQHSTASWPMLRREAVTASERRLVQLVGEAPGDLEHAYEIQEQRIAYTK